MESKVHCEVADELFKLGPKLKDEQTIKENVGKFVRKHCELKNRLVCITSGGTSAPLERNTVRFLSNFSDGNRGAASTEYFLEAGYATIFLYRRNTVQPYCRSVLDCFKADCNLGIEERVESIQHAVRLHHEATVQEKLLEVPYETIFEYLQLLQLIANRMNCLQKNAMFYLAAAVADFYVPWEAMVEHKIHSGAGPITLELALVPKMINTLRREWAPSAFCVSFKLETDTTILMRKANEALHKYNVHAVVANELGTHRDKVIMVTNEDKRTIERVGSSDLERTLVDVLKDKHTQYIS